MTTAIQSILDLNNDLLGMVEESRRQQQWKERFSLIINSLNPHTIVYWYEDGRGEKCPYFLLEFDLCESGEPEDEE